LKTADLLKNSHSNKEKRNVNPELNKLSCFKSKMFVLDVISKLKIPTTGKIKIKHIKICKVNTVINLFLHFTGFEPMAISLEDCCSIQLS
jgi:hypothetical protein